MQSASEQAARTGEASRHRRAGSGRAHHSGVKTRLYTWPLTAVTRKVAGPPRKVPLNSCTSVAPPWRVVCDWPERCPATACQGSGRGYGRCWWIRLAPNPTSACYMERPVRAMASRRPSAPAPPSKPPTRRASSALCWPSLEMFCFGVMEPATFGRLDLPGCAFPADDTNVVPALQKPKVAPRIQKAAPDAADAPPARARDHLHLVRTHAVRVVPNVGQKGECRVTRKVCNLTRFSNGN